MRLLGILKIFLENKWEETVVFRWISGTLLIWLILCYIIGYLLLFIFPIFPNDSPDRSFWNIGFNFMTGLLPTAVLTFVCTICVIFIKWIIENWQRAIREYDRKQDKLNF